MTRRKKIFEPRQLESFQSAMSEAEDDAQQEEESYLSKLYARGAQANSATSGDHHKSDYTKDDQAQGVGKFAVSLLLRLVNETFLSLPILDCRKGQPSSQSGDDLARADNFIIENGSEHAQVVYDACFVDWAQAKLVENPTNKVRNKEDDLLLANLLNTKNQTNFLTHQDNYILSTFKHLDSHQQASNKSSFGHSLADYEFVKLTYLSISTILSICGLLINLFIILIIIFDTRQKRGSSLIRSNNTNKNNLLLFQLTFTGLLLTSYVLLDNINIQSSTHKISPLHVSKSTNPYHQQEIGINHILFGLDASLCSSFAVQLPPPLSTFLPPTPFESEKILCSIPNDKPLNECQTKTKTEASIVNFRSASSSMGLKFDQEYLEQNLALILKFNTRKESQRNGRQQSWQLNYIQHNQSKFIDLTGPLSSISIASSNCQIISTKNESAGANYRRVRSDPFPESEQTSAADPKSSNFGHYNMSSLRIFITSTVPLLINVIAAVHIWTIAALAYDRYCAIAHPLQYLRSIHSSKTRTFLLISWATSVLLNFFLPITFNQISSSLEQIQPSQPRVARESTLNEFYTWSFDNASERIPEIDPNSFENDVIQRAENRQRFSFNYIKRCQFSTKSTNEVPEINSKLFDSYFLNQLDNFWSVSPTSSKNTIMDGKKVKLRRDFIGKLAMLLVETSLKSYMSNNSDPSKSPVDQSESIDEKFYVALLLIFSFFNFMIIVLVPLVIIAICNICIYKIVKVHERRLSITSGTNTTAPMESRNLQRSDNVDDSKSEAGSITSLLFSKIFKIGSVKASSRQDLSQASDQEANQSCLPKHGKLNFQCEKYISNDRLEAIGGKRRNINSNIVNRSKRLIVRQDSYQILTKLNGGDSSSLDKFPTEDSQSKRVGYCSSEQVFSSCNSILLNNSNQKRGQVKRKISDHSIAAVPRRDSTTSQVDDRTNQNQKDLECDTCSYVESPSALNLDHVRYDSGGIMNQLKLAGLSFAGVAIQEPLFGMHHRPLNKSSSCSLGNLHNNQHYNQAPHPCSSPMSRCSVETSSTFTCPKKSFTSLNNSLKIQDNKCPPKLFDNESENSQNQYSIGHNTNSNSHQSHSRLPFTIGTKSAPFNVVIWLILTMLLFTLPHYLLVTVYHIMKFNSANNLDLYMASVKQLDSAIYERQLLALIRLISAAKPSTMDPHTEVTDGKPEILLANGRKSIDQSSFLTMTSIWLACLFRVLFLTMVPLNGWLYGIRSRSIRAKLRMVLKHYISRRQASIEITHRQKSTSLTRSRDSSFMNLANSYYNNSMNSNGHMYTNCNHHSATDSKEIVFKRCSSFSKREITCFRLPGQLSAINPAYTNEVVIDRSSLAGTKELGVPSRERGACRLQNNNNNSIRFLIGDYSTDRDSDNSSSLPPPSPNLQYLSQNTSQSSSLNGSNRSLVSVSINSQSTASSLLNSNHRHQAMDLFNRNYLRQTNIIVNRSAEANNTLIPNLIDRKDSYENSPLITSDIVGNQVDNRSVNHPHESDNIDENLLDARACTLKATRNFSCPDDPKQAYFLANIQRRNSTTELAKSGTLFKGGTVNQCPRCPIRKSPSEIIIPAVDSKHNATDCRDWPTSREKEQSNQAITRDSHHHRPMTNKSNSRSRTTRLLNGWWNHLRENLTRLLINTSANALVARFIEDGHQIKYRSVIVNNRADPRSERAFDSNCVQDQCRVSLLRRSSAESPTKGWKENSLASSIKIDSNMIAKIDNKKRNKMRNSFTLNNIGDVNAKDSMEHGKCRCTKHQTNEHSESGYRHENLNDSGENSAEQSPSYLKPPNFLKLVFEPNNHAAQYAGLSALSPIKECSANHSYASSRTSLNTAISGQANNAQPAMRNLTMVEMNQVNANDKNP